MIHILVGEEDAGNVQLIQKAIQINPSVKIVVSKDGLDAFRKVRTQKFDLIVLHSTLAKVSAVQLATAIRELPNNGLTPIVIYADNLEETIKALNKYKSVHVFQRMSHLDDLKQMVKDLVIPLKKEDESLSAIRVDVRIVNQLVEATDFSLKMFGSLQNIKPRTVESMSNCAHLEKMDICGATAILSTLFAGTILICFPKETYLKIVTNVFGDTQTEINKDNNDAAGELINIIYGQAKTVLVDDFEIDFMKSRAYVIEGVEKVRSYQTSASFVVPFDSEIGEFFLLVSFDSVKDTSHLVSKVS